MLKQLTDWLTRWQSLIWLSVPVIFIGWEIIPIKIAICLATGNCPDFTPEDVMPPVLP